ncbi:TetR family transcriptional regulator [Sorangium cellulosum]|nr:TetR family transcriptional regulator [Sorangium cellulosum]
MVRHFLARQLGDTRKLVWLHLREGARLDGGVFAEEIARLQRLSDEVPEVVRVLYGGVSGSVAWAASPVLSDATPLIEATRGHELGPTCLKVLIDIGDCLVRANELDAYHGALSPDRVFILGGDRYAITHFGFVRLFQLGAEEARQDPYGVAAPELFSGDRIGRRTDVYGFGTLMYELLCKRTFSTGIWPPSFPSEIPSRLQRMIKRSLDEDPWRRQVSVRKILAALTPFAREWEELGEPPETPFAHLFAAPSGSRRKPDEEAPILVEDEREPFASGEAGGRASDRPTPRPSDAPDTARSAPPRDARDHATHAASLAAPRPPDTPDTHKSAIPPRDARGETDAYALPIAPPSALELPDLDPLRPVPPTPSTPPPSPLLPVAPAPPPSTPRRSSGPPGRRLPARRLSAVLALAFLLGSSGALLLRWEQSPRSAAAPRLARVVQGAARRATVQPPPRPSDAPQAPPPVAHRSVAKRQAAFTRQAVKTPSKDGGHSDVCYGLVVCGQHQY